MSCGSVVRWEIDPVTTFGGTAVSVTTHHGF